MELENFETVCYKSNFYTKKSSLSRKLEPLSKLLFRDLSRLFRPISLYTRVTNSFIYFYDSIVSSRKNTIVRYNERSTSL